MGLCGLPCQFEDQPKRALLLQEAAPNRFTTQIHKFAMGAADSGDRKRQVVQRAFPIVYDIETALLRLIIGVPRPTGRQDLALVVQCWIADYDLWHHQDGQR